VRNFAVIADGTNGLRVVNLTSSTDIRTKMAAADVDRDTFRGYRLSNERNDPMTPFDPKNVNTDVITYPSASPVRQVARGVSLDSLTDIAGRRWRDNWLIGSTSLSSDMQSRMRAVVVREVPGSPDVRGDGIGCVARVGDDVVVDADGRCQPTIQAP
jgi:hypothetical protein